MGGGSGPSDDWRQLLAVVAANPTPAMTTGGGDGGSGPGDDGGQWGAADPALRRQAASSSGGVWSFGGGLGFGVFLFSFLSPNLFSHTDGIRDHM